MYTFPNSQTVSFVILVQSFSKPFSKASHIPIYLQGIFIDKSSETFDENRILKISSTFVYGIQFKFIDCSNLTVFLYMFIKTPGKGSKI